jgi:hypothetical protein
MLEKCLDRKFYDDDLYAVQLTRGGATLHADNTTVHLSRDDIVALVKELRITKGELLAAGIT